jgi:hypothetical protein
MNAYTTNRELFALARTRSADVAAVIKESLRLQAERTKMNLNLQIHVQIVNNPKYFGKGILLVDDYRTRLYSTMYSIDRQNQHCIFRIGARLPAERLCQAANELIEIIAKGVVPWPEVLVPISANTATRQLTFTTDPYARV